MEEMLCSGELDLFIGVMYQDNPKLDSTTLLNDHIYMVCSDHLLKKYYPDTWSVLKNRSARGTDLSGFSRLPFLLPHPSMKLRRTIDQCFLAARVKPRIFLESQSTELFISLFPYDYGAFFCTQARLPAFLSAYPEANAFPLTLKEEIIGHRVVIASHKDRVLPRYAQDFISITKEVFAGIATVLPGRPAPFH